MALSFFDENGQEVRPYLKDTLFILVVCWPKTRSQSNVFQILKENNRVVTRSEVSFNDINYYIFYFLPFCSLEKISFVIRVQADFNCHVIPNLKTFLTRCLSLT